MAEEAKTTPDEERPSVSDEEMLAAFSGPAPRANKMFVSITDGGARIAFTEQFSPTVIPSFRSAVMLSFQDAIALRDLLSRQLKDVEKEIKKATATTETGSVQEDNG